MEARRWKKNVVVHVKIADVVVTSNTCLLKLIEREWFFSLVVHAIYAYWRDRANDAYWRDRANDRESTLYLLSSMRSNYILLFPIYLISSPLVSPSSSLVTIIMLIRYKNWIHVISSKLKTWSFYARYSILYPLHGHKIYVTQLSSASSPKDGSS